MPAPSLDFLTPPRKGDHDGAYRWQWAVAFKLWLLLAFATWAVGAFAALGFDGFARAQDVTSLAQEVREGRVLAMETQLFELRLKQCQSEGQLRIALAEKITKLAATYRDLTGSHYQLPACEDLR